MNENALIIVGDLSAKKLVKTKMAKSVLDTGFSALKTMLKYKCENAGAKYWIKRPPIPVRNVPVIPVS